jgi:hypothetical protein
MKKIMVGWIFRDHGWMDIQRSWLDGDQINAAFLLHSTGCLKMSL